MDSCGPPDTWKVNLQRGTGHEQEPCCSIPLPLRIEIELKVIHSMMKLAVDTTWSHLGSYLHGTGFKMRDNIELSSSMSQIDEFVDATERTQVDARREVKSGSGTAPPAGRRKKSGSSQF